VGGQWAVGSGQWAVGSGQWAVGSGKAKITDVDCLGKKPEGEKNKMLLPAKNAARLIFLSLFVVNFCSNKVPGQEPAKSGDKPADSAPANQQSATQQPQPAPEFPDLTLPAGSDVGALQKLVLKARLAKPGNPDQYKAQQTAIRDASAKLTQLLKKDNPAYRQAEIDMITSSVLMLTFFSDKEQATLIQQVTDFLKSRKKLSIQDVQTGVIAAGMIELRPEKKPAHDLYVLMDELLKDDDREEMQSFRLNLQGSIRRLRMLGNKFDFEATTMDGKKLKTEDFAGKFVIVDFFATWCKPCIAEMTLIKAHYEKYKDKGLIVIGISVDENKEELDKFLAENQPPWPIVHDNAENPLDRLQLKYGVSTYPTVLLLNKEGTVISLEARNSEQVRLMQILFESPTPAAPQAATPEAAKQPEQPAK
jgi:thiol-disulfide isomerase/thioredoxin